MRTIAILGATGSIGTQALDIVRRYPDRFKADCLTAHSSADKLFDLVREFRPSVAALAVEPEELPEDVKFCQWFFGPDSTTRAMLAAWCDDALCAIVGIAGLDAVWNALDVCQRVLLANKEALVTGGDLVTAKSAEKGIPLLPVDSEHSAIFQCLQARQGNPVRRLLLTCSGGALRSWKKEDLYHATVRDVLAHPTWNMGGKITVDCASLVNKGLEVIEAHWLFDCPYDRIDVLIQPQSVIHSMVCFEDGSFIGHLGKADMRIPIQYALTYPERKANPVEELDFAALGKIDFYAPRREIFPLMALAYDVGRAGGTLPAVMNAANETLVYKFLEKRISYKDIYRIVADTVERHDNIPSPSLAEILNAAEETKARLAKI